MFRFRYNFLALSQVAASAASILLLTRTFGVSSAADSFFVAFSIISASQLMQLMFFEQFMYFYNDLKASSESTAADFYKFAVTWAVIVGAVSFVVVYSASGALVSIFAGGLEASRAAAARDFLAWFSPYLLFYPVICVNERFLNAEKKFAWPYVIASLPMGVMFLVQVWLLASSSDNYRTIPGGYSAGAALGALLGWRLSFYMGARPGILFAHPSGWALLRNSFAIRFGHNIHNFLIPVAVNNFLSYMSSGAISSYNYAQKLVSALQSVSAGPSQKILASHISSAVSAARSDAIRAFSGQYLRSASALFAGLGAAGIFLVPVLLGYITEDMSPEVILSIRDLYAALLPWSFLMVLESPYTLTIVALKKGGIFIAVNSVFLAVFVAALFVARSSLGIYALPAAGMLAQAINYAAFYVYARNATVGGGLK
jgi:hypothetical protein